MNAIHFYNPVNQPLPAQPSPFQEIKKIPNQSLGIPGPLSYFLLPYEFFQSIVAYAAAKKSQNQEALTDLKLKIVSIPAQYAYSFFALIDVTTQIGIILKIFRKNTSGLGSTLLASTGLGILACTITGAIECRNFSRLLPFARECKKSLRAVKQDPKNTLQALSFLEESLKETSSESKISLLTKLSNRVMPWCAEKIDRELPKIIQKLKTPLLQEEGRKEALSLLKEIQVQVHKKQLTQALSLLAIAVSLAAFACILAFQPYLIPLVLLSISYGIYLINCAHAAGTLHHPGWEFKAIDCVPTWIQNRLFLKE
jgi:hypothetical protein